MAETIFLLPRCAIHPHGLRSQSVNDDSFNGAYCTLHPSKSPQLPASLVCPVEPTEVADDIQMVDLWKNSNNQFHPREVRPWEA